MASETPVDQRSAAISSLIVDVAGRRSQVDRSNAHDIVADAHQHATRHPSAKSVARNRTSHPLGIQAGRSRNGGKKPPITTLVYTRRLPLTSAYSFNKARMGSLVLVRAVIWVSGERRERQTVQKSESRSRICVTRGQPCSSLVVAGERDRPRSTHPTRFHVSATSVLPPVCSCVWCVCVLRAERLSHGVESRRDQTWGTEYSQQQLRADNRQPRAKWWKPSDRSSPIAHLPRNPRRHSTEGTRVLARVRGS